MSSSKSIAAATRAGASPPIAALVWLDEGEARTYPVFDALALRPSGFFLGGGFFLEIDEETTIEFRLPDGAVRARARVVGVERDPRPGMVVALMDVDEATRARITAAASADRRSRGTDG